MKRTTWDQCIAKLEQTGEVDDALLPLFYQTGAWYGGDVEPPSHKELLQKTKVPEERITGTNEDGESILKTTFCHFGTDTVGLPYHRVVGKIICPAAAGLEAPNLKQAGAIRMPNAKRIHLPELRTCVEIIANKADEIDISNLETCGDLLLPKATGPLNIPRLQTVDSLLAGHTPAANLPQLKHAGQIDLRRCPDPNLPELRTVETNLSLNHTIIAHFPALSEVGGTIELDTATTVHLPKLEGAREIWMGMATKVRTPQLKKVESIDSSSAPHYTPPCKPERITAHIDAPRNAKLREAARKEARSLPDMVI